MPTRRDVYLKIEPLPAYSPVAPDDAEHHRYRVDCMRNMGHQDGTIPPAEVERRRLDGLVYREYLDPGYTVLNTAPLISADVNEPRAERRIPGALIYSEPGERLFVHVLNGDVAPHSLHVHGLVYGIDSDGSWPFGVHGHDDRRSDEICPGQQWCYVYDVTEETIGAWPFHDHHMHIVESVNRGLFGGIVVRDPGWPKADFEVPLFFHLLAGALSAPIFDSGTLNPGDPPFSVTFPTEGTYDYVCRFHPMQGIVRVTAAGGPAAAVTILDGPARFEPTDVTIGPGGTVTWTHGGTQPHTASDTGGAGLPSYAFNGRTFAGNTPTIVAETGKRIRWYVFNLDLGMLWHNFHAHSQRWRVGAEIMDTRSLGPAESFVADTIVPPVILLPLAAHDGGYESGSGSGSHGHPSHGHQHGCEVNGSHERGSHDHDSHEHDAHEHVSEEPGSHGQGSHGHKDDDAAAYADAGKHGDHSSPRHDTDDDSGKPHESKYDGESGEPCRRVKLRGDFLVHCHVEMHMMEGMVALVRAIQEVELTEAQEHALGFALPLDHGHECPEVTHHGCRPAGAGIWERLPDAPIFVVHAAVLPTGNVLLWSGTAEVGNPLESRVWNPQSGVMTTQVYGEDLFCSGHAFLADGRLCIPGGAPSGSMRSTHIFDPGTETWTKMADMNQARWYPTVLTLPDGRILAFSGTGANEVEVYEPAADGWQFVAGATRTFPELYPSLHLLPSGEIFYSRAGWAGADAVQTQTGYLTLTGLAAGTWTNLGQQQFWDRQEGTAVIQIDATVSPPSTQVMVVGGGAYGPPAARNPQSAEVIDLTRLTPAPAWTRTADMHFPRTNVNGVLLPDGTIFVVGGQRNGKWSPDPQPVLEPEIYDPRTDTWTLAAPMAFPRQYHSIAVLLPDGRVLTAGGVDPSPGIVERDLRAMEVFSPAYLSAGPRPVITAASSNVAYNAIFDVETPAPGTIDTVVLIRPCAMTHHTDAGQRSVKLPITARTADRLQVQAPADGNIAPPGFYMLFIVDGNGVPSVAHFIHLP